MMILLTAQHCTRRAFWEIDSEQSPCVYRIFDRVQFEIVPGRLRSNAETIHLKLTPVMRALGGIACSYLRGLLLTDVLLVGEVDAVGVLELGHVGEDDAV